MSIYKTKIVKLFVAGIFFLIVSMSSHASVICNCADSVIVGREYLVIAGASENKGTFTPPPHKIQNLQQGITLNDFSGIFIAKNAKICGEEYLYAKQDTPANICKKSFKTKNKTTEAVKNDIAGKESPEIVVPDFPFDSSSLSFSYISKESAIPVSQQRLHEYQATSKVNRENTFTEIKNSNLSLYLPEQRQKFSTAATQCGILTSFSPNSPSL